MPWFAAFFFTVYAGMNSYLFWKVRAAFPSMGRGHYALAAFLLLMIVGPVVVRMVDRAEYPRLADAMGLVAHSWLAMVFWFTCLAIVLDLWNLSAWGLSHWAGGAGRLRVGPRAFLAVAGAIVSAMAAWSFLEARNIRLTTLTVRSSKLPPGAKPIRIVQITDMHLGGGTGDGRLEKVLRLIDEAKPDLLVSTGDLVDSPYENIKGYAAELARVKPPLGKYCIPGNHEYYTGMGEANRFNEAAGFAFLVNKSVKAAEGLWIAGADDPAGNRDSNLRHWVPPDPLPAPPKDASGFVLLLKHRPAVQDSSLGQFDLQLSGHTHDGQIFPFTLVIAMLHKYDRGHYLLDKGSELFVSRGTGTWGPPMRLGSPPEVTLITIEPAPSPPR